MASPHTLEHQAPEGLDRGGVAGSLSRCEPVFVTGQATIMHADLDAFFASVEQRDNSVLRDRPMMVGTGVVLAASYQARAFGVATAMSIARARRLCPSAVVVPPRMDAYLEASRAVFDVFRHATPLVEGLSVDEAFLDVGGLRRLSGTPRQIATRLRQEVSDKVGLTITVGVARTKFLAKVASAAAKPDGLLVVPPEGEDAFLHPLAIERLWGVGPATATKLHARGITTVGDVASLPTDALVAMLGRAVGQSLAALAHNYDPRPVTNDRQRRSVGAQAALPASSWSTVTTEAVTLQLVDTVAARLRAAGVVGRTVTIRLRFRDFTRASRSHTLPVATAATTAILAAVRTLVAGATPTMEHRGLTLLGVTVGNLMEASPERHPSQLSLESAAMSADGSGGDRDAAALDAALDQVRNRFGSGAITRATLLRAR